MDFYSLTPEELQKLDPNALSIEELRDLSYFIWCFYPYEESLQNWRSSKLLPLVINLPNDALEMED